MRVFSGYELLWLFFLYSFLGWILETVTATLRQRKFSNRGLVNGPFCVMYGITAVLISVGITGVDRILAVFVFDGLCDGDRMDRRASDREGF